MFNVIEPHEHHLYESSIRSFLQELQFAVDLEENQDLTCATFILVEEEIEGLEGGILLLKQGIDTLQPEIKRYLETLYPLCQNIWTGMISFQFSEGISGRDYEKISKILYAALNADLIAFGVRENTPFLCLTMPLIEHLSINMLGLWTYILEVKPNASGDGLFHGLLSLAGPGQISSTMWKPDEGKNHFVPENCDKIVTN